MKRTIKSMENNYLQKSLELTETVFTEHNCAAEGKLVLTPIAVKTELQRQHISKELIEYGFARAKEMGFKAVIVEGNPQNYRARGFVTAADHGILPGKSVQLPAIECLMVKELENGALEHISGEVEYTDYETLS